MAHRNAKRTQQQWLDLIQECRSSGFSDQEWCSRQSIPVSTFYNHVSKLRRQACDILPPSKKRTQPEQQVVPLSIIDMSDSGRDSLCISEDPLAIILEFQGSRLMIRNQAGEDVIYHTLLALRRLC